MRQLEFVLPVWTIFTVKTSPKAFLGPWRKGPLSTISIQSKRSHPSLDQHTKVWFQKNICKKERGTSCTNKFLWSWCFSSKTPCGGVRRLRTAGDSWSFGALGITALSCSCSAFSAAASCLAFSSASCLAFCSACSLTFSSASCLAFSAASCLALSSASCLAFFLFSLFPCFLFSLLPSLLCNLLFCFLFSLFPCFL